MSEIHCTIWNHGELFDFRNVLLRQGSSSNNETVHDKYAAVKTIFDRREAAFEKHTEADKKKWWEKPAFNVSEEEKNIIDELRKEKVAEVYKSIFEKSDIVLLQELNSLSDIQFLKDYLPAHFNLAYGKELQQYVGERTDTVVIWNSHRFVQLKQTDSATANKTDQIGTAILQATREKETVTNKRRTVHVILKDLRTDKIVQAVSCHLDGFNLSHPLSACNGNNAAKEAFELCNTVDANLSLIGGDFNSEFLPEFEADTNYYKIKEHYEMTQQRFNLLKEFHHAPNSHMTAYNSDIRKLTDREHDLACLDHLFIKGGSASLSSAPLLPLEDVTANPSDHRPLTFKIQYL